MIVNQFINQNWRGLYKDIVAGARIVWEPMLIEQINLITLNDIPFRAFMYYGDEDVFKIQAWMHKRNAE